MITRRVLTVICAILITAVKDASSGDLCTLDYKGQLQQKYCDVGGCCVSDEASYTGNPEDLCCMRTLTVILIGAFVGGPFLIGVIVSIGCCIKRYHEDKNRRTERNARREERRRRRDDEEAEARNNYYNPKPEDRLRLMPPSYPGRTEDQPPPQYNEDEATNTIPGAVENTQSLQVPNANVLPLTPPPSYEFTVSDAPTLPGAATASAVVVRMRRDANQNATQNLPSPVISERILETRNYLDRFDNIEQQESRNSESTRPETLTDTETPQERRAVTPPRRVAIPPRKFSPIPPPRVPTPPRRLPTPSRSTTPPRKTATPSRRSVTPISKVTPSVIEMTVPNGLDSKLSAYSEAESIKSRPVTITQAEIHKFSKPLQIVTSLPPDEPADLLYI